MWTTVIGVLAILLLLLSIRPYMRWEERHNLRALERDLGLDPEDHL